MIPPRPKKVQVLDDYKLKILFDNTKTKKKTNKKKKKKKKL